MDLDKLWMISVIHVVSSHTENHFTKHQHHYMYAPLERLTCIQQVVRFPVATKQVVTTPLVNARQYL